MSAIFISYARKDGTEIAKSLVEDLPKEGYDVWRDERDIGENEFFDSAIEKAIRAAPAMVVVVTPDVSREMSFVRREIAFALDVGTPIIPLKCKGGIVPITINLLTHINFIDYATGYAELLKRLQKPSRSIKAETLRERELLYLQGIGERFERWLYLYTDMSGRAEKDRKEPKVKVKKHALKYLNTQNRVYQQRGYIEDGDSQQVETVNELREVVRNGGVVLIGEPGSGKTTTLQRLAYEFAIEATQEEDKPLPLFVPLGAYAGGGLEQHFAQYFGDLPLASYLPGRVVLLLDGLNEMPRQYVDEINAWLQSQPNDLNVVVTCRRLDYAALKRLPLRRVDVAPLDISRIRLFIGNFLEDVDRDRLFWALAGEQMQGLWALWQKAGLKFDDFWSGDLLKSGHAAYQMTSGNQDTLYNDMRAALQEHDELPGLLGLVSNPFLLNITVEVFIESGKPPRNRAQLFSAFVDLLIEQRGQPAVSAAHPWIPAEQQQQALAALAYRMQAETMGTSVPVAWVRGRLVEDGIVPDADNLLYLAESATLIQIDPNTQELKFFHQLLQEYFAALKMRDDMQQAVPASQYWPGDWWQPTGWEETAILLAGMEAGVAAWLLDTHPVLACRALSEGLPDADNQARVQARLVQPMQDVSIPPIHRAEVGRVINRIGDPRAGVLMTVRDNLKLPDIDWVEIPAGTFLYGDDKTEKHLDTFWIARYPITNAQFQCFLDDEQGYNNRQWWTEAGWKWKGERTAPDEYGDPNFRLPNHPRIFVRWYESIAFAHWLGARLGMTISLPTEEQWEKAARGTDGRQYPWGDEWDESKCNNRAGDSSIGQTSAVGLYLNGQSPYAVLDMSGNVWEWCRTDYESGSNEIEGGNMRVLRGGSWGDIGTGGFRCADRGGYGPSDGDLDRGFRVSRS